MKVTVNGEPVEVASPMSLITYLESKELPLEGLIIEYNGSILSRDGWEKVTFAEGDQIEILMFVGGG
ncbi:sulfur carrier protein ThiS [Heliorestis convoluta]|uniref:Sulfur carrier protein ThiS n=1 Tax=Heliorestis convoluta TaxID=356322 RepID=A0A5Q2MYK6_9FIRM|nr:sulfur carrier protein ThiS [Heliorestis convoluta]QGG47818.1 sulfur carrier protein ThiS [Heliorestis convoluta]